MLVVAPVSDPDTAERPADAAEAAALAAFHSQRRLAALIRAAVSRADALARLDRALRRLR